MGLYSTFKTDKTAENNGFWFELPTGEGPVPRFKLARMGETNKAYSKLLEKRFKMWRNVPEDKIPTEASKKILLEVFTKTVLLDWENVTDVNDKEIPFSEENAVKILKDLPDLYSILLEQARAGANFKKAELEAASKN